MRRTTMHSQTSSTDTLPCQAKEPIPRESTQRSMRSTRARILLVPCEPQYPNQDGKKRNTKPRFPIIHGKRVASRARLVSHAPLLLCINMIHAQNEVHVGRPQTPASRSPQSHERYHRGGALFIVHGPRHRKPFPSRSRLSCPAQGSPQGRRSVLYAPQMGRGEHPARAREIQHRQHSCSCAPIDPN
jgi:hypothetical protein